MIARTTLARRCPWYTRLHLLCIEVCLPPTWMAFLHHCGVQHMLFRSQDVVVRGGEDMSESVEGRSTQGSDM